MNKINKISKTDAIYLIDRINFELLEHRLRSSSLGQVNREIILTFRDGESGVVFRRIAELESYEMRLVAIIDCQCVGCILERNDAVKQLDKLYKVKE